MDYFFLNHVVNTLMYIRIFMMLSLQMGTAFLPLLILPERSLPLIYSRYIICHSS